jgi:flavodoxin
MKMLVVYEMVYGNTQRIARAITEALGEYGEARTTAGRRNPRIYSSVSFCRLCVQRSSDH